MRLSRIIKYSHLLPKEAEKEERGEKEQMDQIKNNMIDLNLGISIISLNLNNLHIRNEKQSL